MIVQIKRGNNKPIFQSNLQTAIDANNAAVNNGAPIENWLVDGQLGYDTLNKDLYIGDKGNSDVIRIGGHKFFENEFKDALLAYPDELINAVISGVRDMDRFDNLTFALGGFWDYVGDTITDTGTLWASTNGNGFISWNRWGRTPQQFVDDIAIARGHSPEKTDDPYGTFPLTVNTNISGLIDYWYLTRAEFDTFRNKHIPEGFLLDNSFHLFNALSGALNGSPGFVSQEWLEGNARNRFRHNGQGIQIISNFEIENGDPDFSDQIVRLEHGNIQISSRIPGSNTPQSRMDLGPAGVIIRKGGLQPDDAALTIEGAGFIKLENRSYEDEAAVRFDQLKDVDTDLQTTKTELRTAEQKIQKLFGLAQEATFVAFKREKFSDISALPGNAYYNPGFYKMDSIPGQNDPQWTKDVIANFPTTTIPQESKFNIVRESRVFSNETWVSGLVRGIDIFDELNNVPAPNVPSSDPSSGRTFGNLDQEIRNRIKTWLEKEQEVIWRPRNGTQYMVTSFDGIGHIKDGKTWRYWCWNFTINKVPLTVSTSGTGSRNALLHEVIRAAGDDYAAENIRNGDIAQLLTLLPQQAEYIQYPETDPHRQGRVWLNTHTSLDPTTGRPYYMDWQYTVDRINVPDNRSLDNNPLTNELRVAPTFVLDQGNWNTL